MINQLAFKGFPLGAKEVGKPKLGDEFELKADSSEIQSQPSFKQELSAKTESVDRDRETSNDIKFEEKSGLVKKPEKFFESKITDQDSKDSETLDSGEISPEASQKVVNQIQPDQIAILQFMDSLESEHGISPTRFVEVMSDLKPEELKAPASQTAMKVVSQLGLSPEIETEVLIEYEELLSQMKAPDMTLPEMKKLRLQQSLDRMATAFFVSPKLTEAPIGNNLMDPVLNTNQIEELASQPSSADAYREAFKGLQLMTQLREKGVAIPGRESASTETQKGDSAAVLVGLGALGAEATEGLSSPGQSAADGGSSSGFESFTRENEVSKLQIGPVNPKGGEEQMLSQLIAGQISGEIRGNEVSSVAAPLSLKPEVQAENVQAVFNQTQALVKSGGGESTIILKPEGLGAIELKVEVKEGRVNVQMLTESKETKKLFESSTQDLTQMLSEKNLTVDKIKVDTQNSAGFDLNQQQNQQQLEDQLGKKLADLRENLNRESARQFMGQFRDENFNNRNGMLDQGKKTSYRSGGPKPLEPIGSAEGSGPVQNSRYLGSKKGSGLDLVA